MALITKMATTTMSTSWQKRFNCIKKEEKIDEQRILTPELFRIAAGLPVAILNGAQHDKNAHPGI